MRYLALALLALSVGCHAQVPPASAGGSVALTWTAPTAGSGWAGCTTAAPCTYAVYRDTTANDPVTSTNWKQIGTSSTTSYSDTTASGLTAYYNVETVQSSKNSAPSNVAGPFSPSGPPLAPSVNGTSSELVLPDEPQPTMVAKNSAPIGLHGKVK